MRTTTPIALILAAVIATTPSLARAWDWNDPKDLARAKALDDAWKKRFADDAAMAAAMDAKDDAACEALTVNAESFSCGKKVWFLSLGEICYLADNGHGALYCKYPQYPDNEAAYHRIDGDNSLESRVEELENEVQELKERVDK
jgi:hypothetical protein